jgi:hypothetical protein
MNAAKPPSVLTRSRSQAVQHLPGGLKVSERGLDRGAVARDGMPAGEVKKDEVRTGDAVVNLSDVFGDGHANALTETPVSVEVPVCFVDPLPLGEPWRQSTAGPPFDTVQLLFADCRTAHGIWCPTVGGAGIWWGWREVERLQSSTLAEREA